MKLLIIDTSTDKSFIAFTEDSEILLNLPLASGQQSSRFLFPAIESGLSSLKFKIQDIQAIAVAVGPGSFTGVRVGVAAAKGLTFEKKIPLIALSSLSGFISHREGTFISMIDARIGGAYLLLQERMGEEIKEISAPKLVSKENIPEWLCHDIDVVGPSFERLSILGAKEVYPDASHLAKIAMKKFKNGEIKEELELVYLREFI